MAVRAEQGMGLPDGVRLSKGASRLVAQASSLGVDTQRYLGRLTESPKKVCANNFDALKRDVVKARARQGEMKGR